MNERHCTRNNDKNDEDNAGDNVDFKLVIRPNSASERKRETVSCGAQVRTECDFKCRLWQKRKLFSFPRESSVLCCGVMVAGKASISNCIWRRVARAAPMKRKTDWYRNVCKCAPRVW